ncbi:hypothetical protein [Flavivirga algicola]|uniref:DUF4253 domain-containing protein n=1 Tax=Flavivirga algicola TaxID=2729136 RepID=A0ABX1RVR3_9FLAO|nr:hypothetical protein [Flavivirga algicola]NMH86527.1 hypothetical protein [Flavivirga algicola]
MSIITPEFLFTSFKEEFLKKSMEYSEETIPTSLIFQFSKEEILVFHNLEYERISGEDIKKGLSYLKYFGIPIRLRLKYSYNNIDFSKLEEEFNAYTEIAGFSSVSHITHYEYHLFWLGYDRKNISIETIANVEEYFHIAITRSFDQLQQNYFGGISVKKEGESTIFNEKINSLVLYWGEHELDCFYINAPNNSDDLNDGIMLISNINIHETEYLEAWTEKTEDSYGIYDELLFILYRVCAKLKQDFKEHSLFESNFECYPCCHDISESLNDVYMQLAEEHLNLDLEEYLKICENIFEE